MSEFLVSKLSEFFGQNEYLFVYDVISFLGWLNVVLVLIAVSLFTFRRINRYIFANQQPFLKKLNKPLSKFTRISDFYSSFQRIFTEISH